MSLNFTWDEANFWGNWILVASLIIGVIATVTVIISGSVKEAALNKDIADANARAAKANLETEKLKAQLTWREIPPIAFNTLGAKLFEHPGKVLVRYVAGDSESMYFAIQIGDAFRQAKWEVGGMPVQYSNVLLFGIFIPNNANIQPAVEDARAAFTAAGLQFVTEDPPVGSNVQLGPNGIGFSGPPPPNVLIVTVGSKYPPK